MAEVSEQPVRKRRRHPVRDATFVVLVVVGLFGGWLLGVRSWYRSVQPAGPSLAEHLNQRAVPEFGRIVVAGGREFLVLLGPIQALPRFPSGPPVYVFDRAGKLVDWTPDVGDDESFNQRWPGLNSGRSVTSEDVAAWPGSGR
jgi:hypothetical protein